VVLLDLLIKDSIVVIMNNFIPAYNLITFLIKAIIVFIVSLLLIIIIYKKNNNYIFYKDLLLKMFHRKKINS